MRYFYFDTSIWLDVYEKRGRNGEVAFEFLTKIIDEDSLVLFSNLIISELKNLGYSKETIIDVIKILPYENVRKIEISRSQLDEAKKVSLIKEIPKKDALHAILCRDNYAQLISRDAHFNKIKYISIARVPEDFI